MNHPHLKPRRAPQNATTGQTATLDECKRRSVSVFRSRLDQLGRRHKVRRSVMKRRRRIKHEASFQERLAEQARTLREQAKTLQLGKERDDLMRRARQAEIASHINEWL